MTEELHWQDGEKWHYHVEHVDDVWRVWKGRGEDGPCVWLMQDREWVEAPTHLLVGEWPTRAEACWALRFSGEGAPYMLDVGKAGYVPARVELLPWQEKGLQQTASGYGSRLTHGSKVLWSNRWRRVYVCIYSNSGTAYIDGPRDVTGKRPWIVVRN